MKTSNTVLHTDNVGVANLGDKFIIKHIKDNAEVRVFFNPENTTAKEIVSSLNNHYALVEALRNMIDHYKEVLKIIELNPSTSIVIQEYELLLNNINKSK